MKYLIIILVLLYSLFLTTELSRIKAEPYEKLYDFPVVRVIDGDTVEIEANFLPGALKPTLSLRIDGVDTPEKGPRSSCTEENMKSLKAKLFTEQEIMKATQIKVGIKGWDKYGGRLLGDLYLDGILLSKKLMDNGYAVEYHGGTKKSWCHF